MFSSCRVARPHRAVQEAIGFCTWTIFAASRLSLTKVLLINCLRRSNLRYFHDVVPSMLPSVDWQTWLLFCLFVSQTCVVYVIECSSSLISSPTFLDPLVETPKWKISTTPLSSCWSCRPSLLPPSRLFRLHSLCSPSRNSFPVSRHPSSNAKDTHPPPFSAKLASSSFHVVLYGFLSSDKKIDDLPLLTEIVRLLKPSGRFHFRKSGLDDCVMASFVQNLKFAGFVQIQETPDQISAAKPDYETGSRFDVTSKQPLPPSAAAFATGQAGSVWERLAESDAVEDDLINTDDLLTEDDLRKPDPESLRVCGSTGKRKACANCSCGLAEELDEQTKKDRTQNAKSSCGSVSHFSESMQSID